MLIIISVIVYLLVSIILALAGRTKKIGFAKEFFISIFLTPITGIVFLKKSDRKEIITITRYRCNNCGLEYTEYHKYCSACLKEGKKSILIPVKMKSI